MIAEIAEIQSALRQRSPVPDEVFDQLYPRISRFRSSVHWTPVEVAIRVAELLDGAPGGQILDVGAGVGKACIIGALTTANTAWLTSLGLFLQSLEVYTPDEYKRKSPLT